jgi:outer membrane protein TolC
VFDRTARVFAAALLSRDNLNIQAQNIERAQKKLNIVLERITEGLAADYDRIKAELLLAQYKHNHNLARGEFRKAGADLKALIGWDRKYDFMPEGDLLGLNIAVPESLDLEPDNRIEIRRLRLKAEASEEKITINRSAYFPGLGFMAKYDWQNGYQPDLDEIKGVWSVGVSLNWRLIDGGHRKSKVSQARFDVSRINNLRADMMSYIRSEMETAVAEMETATEEISLARKKLKLADEGLKIAEAQYQQGLLGISDLLDIELDRARAEQDLNYAAYNLTIARIDLKKAVGYYPELR